MDRNSPNLAALSVEEFIANLERQNPPYENPEATPHEHVGKICEAKTFYEGPEKCKCCINWVENYPTNIKEAVEKTSDAKRYAIICRVKKAHDVNSNDPLELHSIVVQSPSLKTILGDIFTGYPGITTTLNDVSFYAPFWEFFYRWEALTKAQADYGSESPEHKTICLLLTTLSSQLSSVHNVAKDLIQNSVITYDYLWILFAPGTLVYYS